MTDLTEITVRVKMIGGEPMLDAQGMGLLFGVEPDAVKALPVRDGATAIPREWIRRGRQRASEARAHTGRDTMLDAMHYWAARDRGAVLNVVYE